MTELGQIISRHLADAETPGDTRSDLFDRYMGEPLGDEIGGRSGVQTSEVFDTVEAIASEAMDMLAAERTIVAFKPESEDDVEAAKSETEACNDVFWERNDGFDNLQTFVKSGLIEQNGYIRSGWVEKETITIDEYSGLTIDEALALKTRYETDDTVEDYKFLNIEGFEESEFGLMPTFDDDGQPMPISFKLRCVRVSDEYEITPIPRSNIRMSGRWHKASLQDIPFFAVVHDEMTRSDLVAMGFDPEDVAKCSDEHDDAEKENRHNTKDDEDAGAYTGSIEDLTQQVTVYECWVLSDDNGDGIAERLKVWVATDMRTILHWADGTEAKEEVDTVEVSSWTPIKVPHRHAGRGAAEVVDDVQAVNTVLMRNTLDSIYTTLFPRPEVDVNRATEQTFQDLAAVAPGAPIRTRGGAIAWQQAPQITGVTLPLMEKMISIKEDRIGVTRLNQGMDADTLNKTMGGQQQLMTQGQKRVKLMVRNLAEGLKDLFLRMHRDLRRGNVRKLTYQVDGKWQTEEPLSWRPRTAMNIAVGSGNGDRDEKRSTIGMIGGIQRELMSAGSGMVDEAKLYETVDMAVKLGGFPGAGLFMNDPRSQEYQQAQAQKPPPPPDPASILAQAEAQKAAAQAEGARAEAQRDLAQIQLDALKLRLSHEEKMAELGHKSRALELDETKAAADIEFKSEAQDLAEDKVALDEAFRRDQMAKQ